MKSLPIAGAVSLIPDGASLMIGGFLSVGTPERLMDEIVRQRKRDLTVIANRGSPFINHVAIHIIFRPGGNPAEIHLGRAFKAG